MINSVVDFAEFEITAMIAGYCFTGFNHGDIRVLDAVFGFGIENSAGYHAGISWRTENDRKRKSKYCQETTNSGHDFRQNSAIVRKLMIWENEE